MQRVKYIIIIFTIQMIDLNLFIYGRLRNKLFQLILITFDRSFRLVSIFFFERGFERREKPDLSLYAERQARKHLVPFL